MSQRFSPQTQYAVVIEKFNAEGPFEMTVESGELVQILSQPNPNWSYVMRLSDNKHGYIPTLFSCTLGSKSLLGLLISKRPSSKGYISDHSSSSSSSSSSPIHCPMRDDLIDKCSNSISSASSVESKNILNNIKTVNSPTIQIGKKSRLDPDGGSSSEGSMVHKYFTTVTNMVPYKIYENIEPNDYERNIIHHCVQAPNTHHSSDSSLRTISSKTDLLSAEIFLGFPRRLFIDNGDCYGTIVYEIDNSLEKLTLV